MMQLVESVPFGPHEAGIVSDEQLLSEYVLGNELSFCVLIERYHRPLLRFLTGILGETAAAEDVAQETYLRVHRSADRFERDRAFRPWLFSIAANAAKDLRRWNRRRSHLSLRQSTLNERTSGSWLDTFAADTVSPCDHLELSELKNAVREVIECLAPKHREVLKLAYFGQLSYQDIGRILQIPLGTVKSRLHSSVDCFARKWDERSRQWMI